MPCITPRQRDLVTRQTTTFWIILLAKELLLLYSVIVGVNRAPGVANLIGVEDRFLFNTFENRNASAANDNITMMGLAYLIYGIYNSISS